MDRPDESRAEVPSGDGTADHSDAAADDAGARLPAVVTVEKAKHADDDAGDNPGDGGGDDADGARPESFPSFIALPPPDKVGVTDSDDDADNAAEAEDDPYAAAFADPPRRATIWPAVLSVVGPLAVLGAAGWWVWQERTGAAEWAVPRIAALAGFDLGLTVVGLEPDGLSATDVRLGGGVEAASVAATYSIAGLLRGRVDSLAVDGLTIEARRAESGWQIDGLTDGQGGAAPLTTVPDLPFTTLDLTDATINVAIAGGTIAVAGGGAVTTEPDGAVAATWDGRVVGDGDGRALGGGDLAVAGRLAPTEAGLALAAAIEVDGALGEDVAAVLGDGSWAQAGASGAVAVDMTIGDATSGSIEFSGVSLAAPLRDLAVSGVDGGGSFDWPLGDVDMRLVHGGVTVGDWAFGGGPLALQKTGDEVTVEGLVDLPMGRFDARVSGSAPDAPVTATVAGTLQTASAAALVAGVAAEGTVDLDLAVQAENVGSVAADLSAPGDLAGWLAVADRLGLVVEGRIDADVAGVTALGVFTGGALRGPIEGRLDPDGVQLAALGPVAMGVSRVTMPGLDGLAGVLPAEVLFGGDAGTPLRLDIRRADDGFEVAAVGGVAVDGLPFALAAEIDGTATVTPAGLTGMDVPFVLATVGGIDLPGGRGDVEVLLSDVGGTFDDLTGEASVGLAAPLLVVGGVTLAGVTGEIDGGVGWDGTTLAVTPAAGSRVALGGVSAAAGWRLDGPVALALADGAAQKIAIGRDGTVTADISLANPAPVTVARAGETVATVDLADLRLEQDRDGARARFDGAAVTVAGQPVTLDDIGGDVAVVDGQPSANVSVGRIEHGGDPAPVVPLTARLSVAPGDDGVLTLQGEAGDAGGRIRLAFEGRHDLASGRGAGDVTLEPLAFLPTVLQPEALFPVLAGRFREVDADIGFAGTARWGDGGFALPGTVSFEARSLGIDEVRVENARGDVVFEDLVVPRTPPGQTISVGLIDVGVPLTDGEVVVHLPGDGAVNAQLTELEMFGGSLESDPFSFRPPSRDVETVLRVEGVALDQMLAATKGAGELAVSGTLDGVIPLSFVDGEASIAGGQLATKDGGGVLRYVPGDVGALDEQEFSTGLFLDAVKNFHYDSISLSIDEGEAEDLRLGLQLRGNNPDLYGGAPLELNVNLEGPLQQVLSRGLATYTLPSRLGRELGTGAAE